MKRSCHARRGRWRLSLGSQLACLRWRETASERASRAGSAERLHIIVAKTRKKGIEVLEPPTLASWAVRRAEWTANHLVRSDVEMVDGSIVEVSPYEAHTGKLVAGAPSAFVERIW